jgi:hypothetical protein
VPQLLQRARNADPAGIPAVPVGHRVGIPWDTARRIGGERKGVFGHFDAEGLRLGAPSAEPLMEQLTGQQVQRQDAALTVLRRLLDPASLLDDVVLFDLPCLAGAAYRNRTDDLRITSASL